MKVYLAYYRDDLIAVFDNEIKAKECCENIVLDKLDEGQTLEWENGSGVVIDNLTNNKMVLCEIEEWVVK